MANLLTDLEIHEISLVDKGASGDGEDRPRIVIAKREPTEKAMSLEDVLAKLPQEEQAVVMAALEAAAKPAESMPEPEMEAEKAEESAPVAKPEDAAPPMEEKKPEDEIAKALESVSDESRNLVLEAIEKREALEKRVAELEDREERAKFIDIAKSMDSLPGMTTEQRANLLRSASKAMTAQDYAAVEKSLRDAADAVKKSVALAEVGSSATEPATARDRLAAIAKSIREKNPNLSEAQAKMAALAQNPEIYQEVTNS